MARFFNMPLSKVCLVEDKFYGILQDHLVRTDYYKPIPLSYILDDLQALVDELKKEANAA